MTTIALTVIASIAVAGLVLLAGLIAWKAPRRDEAFILQIVQAIAYAEDRGIAMGKGQAAGNPVEKSIQTQADIEAMRQSQLGPDGYIQDDELDEDEISMGIN